MQLEFPHYPTPAELEQFYIPFPDGDPLENAAPRSFTPNYFCIFAMH
jgi:hypothetical protein